MGTGKNVFMTGATGYVGRRLAPALMQRGHLVRALIRAGSESKAPPNCEVVRGDPLDAPSFADKVAPSDTFVQLVGVPHPSPAKAAQFRSIDLVSVRSSVANATRAKVAHFVYVSVAQPAPMMKVYQAVRAEGEALIRSTGLRATILRPWYILGPGHWWPYAIVPLYWICERIPMTRAGAQRLGLVSIRQIINALVHAVEHPPADVRIIEVPEIRDLGKAQAQDRLS
jgi:nucleoside-diphosphate-sugar epimerase